MTRPKISQTELDKLITGHQIADKVYLVGIRGYYLNTMGKVGANDRNLYDDAIILVTPNGITTFNGNTDPSRFKGGVATLVPGLHWFKKGKHGISKPSGAYPALRPATPDESLPVYRDGQPGIHKGIAINIHKGNLNYTSSAGCQTLYPDQWTEFINKVYKAMDSEGMRKIAYLLIENK